MLDFSTVDTFIKPLFYVTDMQKRIFWGYLLASFLLALVILAKQKKLNRALYKKLLTRQFWINRSIILDIKLIFFNNMLWALWIAPFFGTQIALALAVRHGLVDVFGQGDFITASTLTISLSYTFILFVLDDFSRFFVHYSYHKIPVLWRFHAVHHSATTLTPITLYRVHIVEMLINACRSILVSGIVGGMFIYAVDGRISPFQILGASVFSLAFNLAGANLRHSHIWLSFGRFEHFILSPAQHQIHHSEHPKHYDKNFGVMIALWDRLFGTFVSSKGQRVDKFGLSQPVDQRFRSHIFGIKP